MNIFTLYNWANNIIVWTVKLSNINIGLYIYIYIYIPIFTYFIILLRIIICPNKIIWSGSSIIDNTTITLLKRIRRLKWIYHFIQITFFVCINPNKCRYWFMQNGLWYQGRRNSVTNLVTRILTSYWTKCGKVNIEYKCNIFILRW